MDWTVFTECLEKSPAERAMLSTPAATRASLVRAASTQIPCSVMSSHGHLYVAGICWVLFSLFAPKPVQGGVLGIIAIALVVFWVSQLPWVQPLASSIRARRLGLRDHPEIRALMALWRALGIEAAETASLRAIRAFEREYGVIVPQDLRAYFALLNGTRNGECGTDDPFGVGFWHLNQIRTFAETRISCDDEARMTFAFADYAVRKAVYGVRLSSDTAASTPVIASLPSGQVKVAASFAEFVGRYLVEPQSVLLPGFDVIADENGIGSEIEDTVTCSIPWSELRSISIVVACQDGNAQACWVLVGERPASPVHALVVPVVLTARPDGLTRRLRSQPGFLDQAFEEARLAEQHNQEGTFLCWKHPEVPDDPVDAGSGSDR